MMRISKNRKGMEIIPRLKGSKINSVTPKMI